MAAKGCFKGSDGKMRCKDVGRSKVGSGGKKVQKMRETQKPIN